MFTSISWQQYVVAVFIITVAYYGYVLLRYYRPEIQQFFQKKKTGIVSHTPISPTAVLGTAQPDPGLTITDSQELMFAASDNPDEGINPYEQALEQETTDLAEAFLQIDDKPQFLSLLSVLIKKYQPFSTEMKLQAPIEKVWERYSAQLPFQLSVDELPLQ